MFIPDKTPDILRLAEKIRTEAEKYELCCTIVVSDGTTEQRMDLGGAGADDIYALDGNAGFMLGLSVMLLEQDRQLSHCAPITDFIPADELPETRAKSSLMLLMLHRSMLPDPIHGALLPELHRSEEYALLDPEEAARREQMLIRSCSSLADRTAILRSRRLRISSGLAPSSFDDTLLAELVERVSGLSLSEFQHRKIFEPLGISPAESEPGSSVYLTSVSDLTAILNGLMSGQLLDRSHTATAHIYAMGGRSIPFGRRQEILCARSCVSGSTVEMLLDIRNGARVLVVSHSPLPEVRRFDRFRRLDLDVAQIMNAESFSAFSVVMKHLTTTELQDALAVEPADDQKDFVSTPAAAIAESMMNDCESFALSAGSTTVGIITLAHGPAPRTMLIDTLIIDRHYQRRGYGRAAVIQAMNYARKEEMRRMLVCVDRRNTAARALYDSLGFEICEVYDHAYVLIIDLTRI